MAKVINRDVPIAEENTTLTGQPATNMYDDWSEEMEDRADNVYDDTKKKSAGNKKSKEKKLKEIDEVEKARNLFDRGKISEGHYMELLHKINVDGMQENENSTGC